MSDADLRKKTEKAFNEKVRDNVKIDNNGNTSLKYDSTFNNQDSLFEDVKNKAFTFFFGTSNEIKEEMYKNNNLYELSEGKSFDTVAYIAACTCLISVPILIPDKNIQNIVGIDALLRISPVLLGAGVNLIKQEKTGMDHRIYPGIVGSIRDYISMAKG